MNEESIFAALNELKQARKDEECRMLDSFLADLWSMCGDLRRIIARNEATLNTEETKRERFVNRAA